MEPSVEGRTQSQRKEYSMKEQLNNLIGRIIKARILHISDDQKCCLSFSGLLSPGFGGYWLGGEGVTMWFSLDSKLQFNNDILEITI